MNVILIEPDVVLARAYKYALIQEGHEVRVCLDPQAAMEQMDADRPDAIILELQMAPLSGFAFLNELRSYEDFTDIPAIIFSSVPKDNFKVTKDAWRHLGVAKYLYKGNDSINRLVSTIGGLQK